MKVYDVNAYNKDVWLFTQTFKHKEAADAYAASLKVERAEVVHKDVQFLMGYYYGDTFNWRYCSTMKEVFEAISRVEPGAFVEVVRNDNTEVLVGYKDFDSEKLILMDDYKELYEAGCI